MPLFPSSITLWAKTARESLALVNLNSLILVIMAEHYLRGALERCSLKISS
jgi:hypothetical protein